jgi:D-beta-D-heptose 7-phosphate kinase/D-beta-D-heptose 1-phosphate adenosyltransferase
MKNRAQQKISSRTALRSQLARRQARGERIVFTSGCFDVLHIGHLRSMEQARSLGDVLVVGVNRDRRVRELKGRSRPAVPERQRAELLAGFECVDHVVLFGEDTPVPLIRALKPDIVCKGGEYRGAYVPEKETIESLGGRFVLLRQVPGVRSSSLIKRSRR